MADFKDFAFIYEDILSDLEARIDELEHRHEVLAEDFSACLSNCKCMSSKELMKTYKETYPHLFEEAKE